MGTAGLGNAGRGVMIDNVPGNVIGTSLATGNVLSGNNGTGLIISGSGATGNLVLGNYIGTDFFGSKAVANSTGVAITGAPGNTILANLISGNNGAGLVILGSGATGNLVLDNYIGTDISGTKAVANALAGLAIIDASSNTIGGTNDLNPDGTIRIRRGNLISGNGGDGVFISTSQGSVTGNVVAGNYIGTDASGATAVDNSGNGVVIADASNNTIGGTTAVPATSSRATIVMASSSRAARRATWCWTTTSAPTSAGPRPWLTPWPA